MAPLAGGKDAGRLALGIDATTAGGVAGALDYRQQLTRDWGNLSAFGRAQVSLSRRGQLDASLMAGLEVRW